MEEGVEDEGRPEPGEGDAGNVTQGGVREDEGRGGGAASLRWRGFRV